MQCYVLFTSHLSRGPWDGRLLPYSQAEKHPLPLFISFDVRTLYDVCVCVCVRVWVHVFVYVYLCGLVSACVCLWTIPVTVIFSGLCSCVR